MANTHVVVEIPVRSSSLEVAGSRSATAHLSRTKIVILSFAIPGASRNRVGYMSTERGDVKVGPNGSWSTPIADGSSQPLPLTMATQSMGASSK